MSMRKIVSLVVILVSSIFAESNATEEVAKDDEYEIFASENIKKAENESFEQKRFIATILNLFPTPGFGLGSFFIMGDIKGGIIQLGLATTGLTLMILNQGIATCDENCGNVFAFSVGAVMMLSGVIYGIIRPFYYDKPKNAIDNRNNGFNLAILPNEQGDFKMYLFFNKAF